MIKMCYGEPYKWLNFVTFEVWHRELYLYFFDKKIAHNLEAVGQIMMHFWVIM